MSKQRVGVGVGGGQITLLPQGSLGLLDVCWWESWQVTMTGIMGDGKAGMGRVGVGWGWLGVRESLKVGLGVVLARSLRSGAESRLGKGLEVGIRGQAVASLGQGASASATGQWAAGGWPACLPSAAGQLPPPLPRQPPSQWPHSCPACHSPARSAPPGPSGDRKSMGEERQECSRRRQGKEGIAYHCQRDPLPSSQRSRGTC